MENSENKETTEKDTLADFINSEALKSQERLLNERKLTVKRVSNAMHLEHLGEFSITELNEIQEKLKQANLELSSFNKSGVMYNCLEDYMLVSYFVLNPAITSEILKGIGINALWDTIKWPLIFGWNKIKGQTYYKGSAGKIESKKVKYGLQVNIDGNTSINLEIEGDLNEVVMEKSLDKILDFLREQKTNPSYKIPDYAYYSEQKEKWIKVDVMDEIRKKADNDSLKQKRKKKKK